MAEIIGITILGLIVGSFLNVCIIRLPKQKDNIFRESRCVRCKNKIDWYNNIPLLSYLLLGGKCKRCKKKINWMYPIVEGLTAVIFYMSYQNHELSLDLIFTLIFFSALVVVFFTDFNYFLIFDVVTLPLTALGVIISLFNMNPFYITALDSIFGAVIGYLIIYLIRWTYFKIKKVEGMGLGDAKLFLAIGAWLGVNSLLFVLFVSALLGSIYGIIYIIVNNKNKKTELAYGCFIILAVVLYQFFGKDFYNFINHPFVL